MNRIILKVKLTSDKTAKITLVYIDKKFLSMNNNDFKYFYSERFDFMIYSFNNFTFTGNAIKLPNLKNYKSCESIEVSFNSDIKLKKWLKSLYCTLQEWNDNFTLFQRSSDYEYRPTELKLEKENWIL